MNKFSEFSSTVDTLNPSVIGITETWLRPDINDIEIKLNAYEAFRCDRELNNGGGALLFIHKQLKSKPCNYTVDRQVCSSLTEFPSPFRLRHFV